MPEKFYHCVLCGMPQHGYGNNPRPIVSPESDPEAAAIVGDDPRACNDCNALYVIPVRLGQEKSGHLYDPRGLEVGDWSTERPWDHTFDFQEVE